MDRPELTTSAAEQSLGAVQAEEAVRPFKISIPDAGIADLRERLARTRWTDAVSDRRNWEDGADISYMRKLCYYWRDGFDWRTHEARLNALPQFKARVDGLDIH